MTASWTIPILSTASRPFCLASTPFCSSGCTYFKHTQRERCFGCLRAGSGCCGHDVVMLSEMEATKDSASADNFNRRYFLNAGDLILIV